ncbi:MAG: TrkH family potassium uptake protein [Oscillospiraceae bacterium]|jgi:trk system potassium uptake protein TrkH|nr:TrkH family potassium uptake protein [Oscillospiraceae bacterium]
MSNFAKEYSVAGRIKRFFKPVRRAGFYTKLLFIIAVLIAAPSVIAFFYPEETRYIHAFLVTAVAVAAIALLTAIFGGKRADDAPREWMAPVMRGAGPVMFAWGAAILAGAAPFVLGGQLTPIHALFESVSGWSTTGLSVSNVDTMPHIFLFHRAFMQYCGGLGFIIFIGILIQGRQLTNLYNAEGHPDSMMPNVRRAARVMFAIYACSLVFGTVVYSLLGMSVFDAVCHTMSALSTAGFTTHSGSIGSFGSLPIELFTVLLMLIGCSNFAVLLLLVKGKFKRVWRTTEVRVMLVTIAVFVPLIALSLSLGRGQNILAALREAVFGVVSLFSTTGFRSAGFTDWVPFAFGLGTLLVLLGGSTGSTAGGIKFLRVYVLFRVTKANIKRKLSPSREVTVLRFQRPQGAAKIDNALVMDTVEYVVAYMAILIIGTLLLTLTERCGLFDAFYEFMSAFTTVGLSNGLTAGASPASLILLMFGMVLGRLEIFIVFVGLYSAARTIKRRLAR